MTHMLMYMLYYKYTYLFCSILHKKTKPKIQKWIDFNSKKGN